MDFTVWFVVIGAVLIVMAFSSSVLKRLPLSTSLIYLAVGVAIERGGLARPDAVNEAAVLVRIAEIAVIVSLFTAGLKLRVPLRDSLWRLPVILAFGSMTITVGLIAVAGVIGLGLSLGAAILLGAVLSPTDPVLASDVQVTGPRDADHVRFTLTGEAGLNDGSAFPFVMLGLGLLGLHDLGAAGWRWLTVDVIWATVGGFAIGLLLGTGCGSLMLALRRRSQEAAGLDDFLALGLIALTYGAALLAMTYGFLAVFAAGLALRRIEARASGLNRDPEATMAEAATAKTEMELAAHPSTAPAYMAQAVLGFNEQLERIGEVAVVILLGMLLAGRYLPADAIWFVPLLLLVIRPLAAALGMAGSAITRQQRTYIAWFGMRGLGSVYYLMYSIEHGLPEDLARRLTGIVLTTVAVSVIVHGVSVTPLMRRYGANGGGR